MTRLCYSNSNEMIFPSNSETAKTPLVPGVLLHTTCRCSTTVYTPLPYYVHVRHDVVAGILGLQLFIYVGYHVHGIINVYMTLMGLYLFAQIDCIAALCSYPCRLLVLSPFVHVYHCTVILSHTDTD